MTMRSKSPVHMTVALVVSGFQYIFSRAYNVHLCMQTLGNILIAKPECMLQKEIMNLIEATLSSGVDYRLKVFIFSLLASTLL